MAFPVIQIREPADAGDIQNHISVSVLACFIAFYLNAFRQNHPASAIQRSISHPHFIFLQKREDFFIRDGVLVSHDNEFFIRIHNPFQKFAEERKRRICDDDVRLLAERFHLVRTKIPVLVQIPIQLDVVHVHAHRPIRLRLQNIPFPSRLVFLRIEDGRSFFKKRKLAAPRALEIRRGNEFLETEAREIRRKVAREIRPLGIVARAENRLAAKHVGVVLHIRIHLRFDVAVLCIKFIILREFRLMQSIILRHPVSPCEIIFILSIIA